MELITLMMTLFQLVEPVPGFTGIVHASLLTWFTGTVKGMEPLLMLLFTAVTSQNVCSV